MFDIKENLKKLPETPGVYMHKDRLGEVIYVGKAISLKNRVRQYFQSTSNMSPKVRAMVGHIEEFEYITTSTEMEALILECTLIKRYMPKYNVLLRDDKTFPYVKVTVKDPYPRILKVRRIVKDDAKYFGPYTEVAALNRIVDLLNDTFHLKRCSAIKFTKGHKPCLNFHINKCKGVCTGGISEEEYRENVGRVMDFLAGKEKEVLDSLKAKMLEESEAMNFERAAECRDSIEAIKAISQKQRVVLLGVKDMDIVLPLSGKTEIYVALFFVRDGKLSGRETFPLRAGMDQKPPELVGEFIKQYYSETPNIPYEILVDGKIPEKELLEDFLGKLSGRITKITEPQKGDKRALLNLAKRDAVEMTKSIDERADSQRERSELLAKEVGQVISDVRPLNFMEGIDSPDGVETLGMKNYRIEAYDISNTNGIDSVGVMVVFEGSKPMKKDYRRFKIKTIEGPNDYGSLQEVIFRRFKRAEQGDAGFSTLPDALFIDGGINQVSAVEQMLRALKINIPVVGMAKDNHHRTRALVYFGKEFDDGSITGEVSNANNKNREILLKGRPLLFKYTGRIQEEVHRFAIDYHRSIQGKKITTSILDEIEGVGAKRRNALLSHYGSIDSIKNATIEELMEAVKIPEGIAKNIKEYFN